MGNNLTSVTSLSGEGLRDWLVQRLTSIILGIYILFLLAFIFFNPNMVFPDWRDFFANPWVQVFSVLFLLSLVAHAWVGMWTIATDYIKITWLRVFFEAIVILALFCYLIWGIYILYR